MLWSLSRAAQKWGRAGVVAYGTAVLVLSAAEEWVFRQFLLGDAVSAVAPRWLGFLGKGMCTSGWSSCCSPSCTRYCAGSPEGFTTAPGASSSPPEVDRQRLAGFSSGAVFHRLYFPPPRGRVQHRGPCAGEPVGSAQHRGNRRGPDSPAALAPDVDPGRDAARREGRSHRQHETKPVRPGAGSSKQPGAWFPPFLTPTGARFPPRCTFRGRLGRDPGPARRRSAGSGSGRKASGTDVDQRIMAFFTGWLAELKKPTWWNPPTR